ncbi:MAG: tetratricopeptide repeat protein [Acidobacteria bacterium]|nr:MAG: tetratricopeptide repeat protein [Acidobacteriota bacterium]
MITYKLLLGFTLLMVGQLMTGKSSLLQVYAHFKWGFSAGSEFDGSIIFEPQRELQVVLHFANEEGNRDVQLPQDFQQDFVIRLEKDGRVIPSERLGLRWADHMRKYVYMGEPKFDPTDFSILEAHVGIEMTVTLTLKSGAPFSYGDYEIKVSFDPARLKFTDGTKWQGRNFSGHDRLRISEVKTMDDVKKNYALRAGNALLRNDLDKALELYERLITLDPDNPGYHSGLGLVYLRRREYEKAIKHFEKALPEVLRRGEPTALPGNLALAYLGAGREDKAIEIYKRFYHVDEKRMPQVIRDLRRRLRRITAQPR